MAQTLEEWVLSDVRPYTDKPLSWLSQYHFFRDPTRPVYADSDYFFSPADGIILYQKEVKSDGDLIDIKGKGYTLRDALRDPTYDKPSLVVGIFMTFFDVHINRIPYSGRLSYRLLDAIGTLNLPMLEMEKSLVGDLKINLSNAAYLHHNERVVNRVDVPELAQSYYMLQIADYDVDSITPFDVRQNRQCRQGARFSQIRYGSQVDLIIPLSGEYGFIPVQEAGSHVRAGMDPLVKIEKGKK
ncbi:MAG: phosphatidylserine decarboxylase [Kutzneria sp.]|nr:phosphatidylserine decarboxylase [Kutzneria sp.]MBV9844952.1 phosphatidylserine decarboxylase [Kutzneria sp.]